MDEFKDAKSRLENRDYLNKLIEEITILKSSEEWVEIIRKGWMSMRTDLFN